MHMNWIVLARLMIASALPLGILPHIPAANGIVIMVVFAVALGLMPITLLRLAGIALLMVAWTLTEARQMVNAIGDLTAATIEATVRVTEVREQKQQLTVQILRVGQRYQFPPLFVMLNNASMEQPYCAGQRWQMKLRLRAVHGRLNQGEFDLQRFALSNHTPLQGRIISKQVESLTCNWRTRLINHHLPAFDTLKQPAIMQALAFGIRTNMTEEQRQLLRETGTAHLMAISGMHIALAASVGWLLARAIQVILPGHLIGHLFPLLVSVMTAATYTWVSGSHAPAQRAMIALILWIGMRSAGWQLSGWQVWTLCIGALLVLDPLTVLSEC
ncbi:DNA internalization-related competence protein ComEC/Rec2, partial [Pantoea endophytica]